MADFKYQRDTNRFFCLGLDLNRPVDSIKELQWARLKNVRTYQIGRIEPRPGLTLIGSVNGPVHSIRRFNAPRVGSWTRVIGSDINLSTGQTLFNQIDTGYSGNPLALVPYRPAQSPDPWMYVMDSARQRKLDIDSNLHFVGLPPPITAPTVTRAQTSFKELFIINGYERDFWRGGPNSYMVSSDLTVNRVNTTISYIAYDSGTTGWCTICPTTFTGIGDGMDIHFSSKELVMVHDSHQGNEYPGTIQNISFISGTAGACSIVFTSLKGGVEANGLLHNTSDGTYARIEAVVEGPDENISVICTTPAGSTWITGDTVYAVSSFRCWTYEHYAAGEAFTNKCLKFTVSNSSDGSQSTCFYWRDLPFSPSPLDLTTYSCYEVGGTHIQPYTDDTKVNDIDDYFHISIAIKHPERISSIRIVFIGDDLPSSSNPLNPANYFYKDFTPADIVEIGVDNKSHGSGSLFPAVIHALELFLWGFGGADMAWKEYMFKIGSCGKIGKPSWQKIYGVQFEITLNSPPDTWGSDSWSTPIALSSFTVRGGFGPDCSIGADYIYRYRARCSSTGVASNWSPATREGFYLVREKLEMAAPAQYTLAAEADRLDFQRKGGALTTWNYLGSVANSATPATFTDKYPNDVVAVTPAEDQIHYQLWPTLGAPVSGTTASVCGTIVTASLGVTDSPFSTVWAPQTQIEINGTFYQIYRVNSANQLELFESAGNQGSVPWVVHEPVIPAQPLSSFWGPVSDTLFACGDPVNPQRLYWTNIGSADDTQLKNWIDITTPSEPLMNGVIYNGRSYVWSSERFFQIMPAGTDEAGNVTKWTYVEIPNGKGLFAKWSFTGVQGPPGLILYWLAREGIYATDGGAPHSITDETMRPLFPNEGNLGESVNGIPAPNIVKSVAPQHRLSYIDDYLYYDYADTTYTPPEDLTFMGSDALFAMVDSYYAGPFIGLKFTDAMPTPFDSFSSFSPEALGGSGALSDNLGIPADSLGVTRT
jgi:hypothetical protein